MAMLTLVARLASGETEQNVVIESPGYTVASLPAGADFLFAFNAKSTAGAAPFTSAQIFDALQYIENALNSRRTEWEGR